MPHPAVMEFLLNRRSRPAKTLSTPVPKRDELLPILTAAARSPDHGKLEPWRFMVLTGGAPDRLARLTKARGAELGIEAEKIAKAESGFAMANLIVAVVAVSKPSEKIPEIEQSYSAGAVCLALLNAALASGWGANWLTDWVSRDREFLRQGLGLADHESVAGFIHIGSETSTPPERPRPDVGAITQWVEA